MTRSEVERLVAHYGARAVIGGLGPFVSERRQARIDAVLDARLRSVQVAIERPYDPHNAAAVVRSAEAVGAWAVHVIAASQGILRSRKTTAGTHHWIETRHYPDLEGFLAARRERGMLLAGACVDATHMLEQLPVDRPLCLMFGNEHDGLSAEAQQACDLRFRIPIHGFAESYNLSVAAAVSLYSVTSRRRRALGTPGDLDPQTREIERARWLMRSVDERHVRVSFPAPEPSSA